MIELHDPPGPDDDDSMLDECPGCLHVVCICLPDPIPEGAAPVGEGLDGVPWEIPGRGQLLNFPPDDCE